MTPEGEAAPRAQVLPSLNRMFDADDLLHKVNTQDTVNETIVANEWFYVGSDPRLKEYVGKQVRRDVSITVKQGLVMGAEQGGFDG